MLHVYFQSFLVQFWFITSQRKHVCCIVVNNATLPFLNSSLQKIYIVELQWHFLGKFSNVQKC